MTRIRKIAVNRLLPSGEVLYQQVIELNEEGIPVGYHALVAEESFTEWIGGEYRLSDSADETLHK
jgi:hypothetical protein